MKPSYKVKLDNEEILYSLSLEDIKNFYINGKIHSHTLCQVDENESWHLLRNLEEMRPFLAEIELSRLGNTIVKKDKGFVKNLDETIIINRPEDQEEQKNQDKNTVVEESIVQEEEPVDIDTKTRSFTIRRFLDEIEKKAGKNYNELEKQKKESKKEISRIQKVPNTEEISKKRKSIRPIAAIAIVVLFSFLLFDDEDESTSIRPNRITLSFPTQNEFLNEGLAKKNFLEGVTFYKKGTYLSKVIATKKFSLSLHHKFQNNKSLGYLILSYAELLPNAKKVRNASVVLNKLIRIAGAQSFSDINIAMGKALYFLNLDRAFTAIKTIEDYVKITKKPTIKLYSIYLKSLIRIGDFDKAKRVYDRIIKNSNHSLSPLTYKVLSEYHKKNQNYQKSYEFIVKGLKVYPQSVLLLLDKVDHAFRIGKMNLYQAVLTKIEKLGFESCPEFFAKYLEHLGVVSAIRGNVKKAAVFFKNALKENETIELTSKLATLEIGGDKVAQQLILKSKIVDQMRHANDARKKYQWEQAFLHAINAVDMNEKYIPSHLLLADIQIERGFFKSAIETLQRLKKSHPTNPPVLLKLINAYIESNRFYDALKEFDHISSLGHKISNSGEYALTLAKYFERKKFYAMALNWYKKSIVKDPLNDKSYFSLARIYKKSNQLRSSKKYLIEALNLNPEETRYKVLYSKILREESGSSVAIGYLRGVLENSRDRIILLGEIASNYYESGQLKYFQDTYKKIEGLSIKNESFYKFMLQTSQLNDEKDKVIEYSRKLIKIAPGLIDVRITLAEAYLEKKEFDLAIESLLEAQKRMPNFPRVNYHLSKVYYLKNDLIEAMKFTQEEIQQNPRLHWGYLMKGKIFFKQKEYHKAVKSYEQALILDHRNVESLIGLAIIRKLQNKYEQARELLQRAIRFDKNRPDIHKELGLVYRGIGQGQLAVEFLESYLLLSPAAEDSSEIKNIIGLLK